MLERLSQLIEIVTPFDVRGSSDLWKCYIQLLTKHSTVVIQSRFCTKSLDLLRTAILRAIMPIWTATVYDRANVVRQLKVAAFYANLMLRVYQSIGTAECKDEQHFDKYVHMLMIAKV